MQMEHFRILLCSYASAKKVGAVIMNLEGETCVRIVTFLWRLWSERNAVNAQERPGTFSWICSSTVLHTQEYLEHL